MCIRDRRSALRYDFWRTAKCAQGRARRPDCFHLRMADTGRRIGPSRIVRRFGVLALCCVGLACASEPKPAPVVATKPPPPPPPVKLAWMPLDALDAPVVARAVN